MFMCRKSALNVLQYTNTNIHECMKHSNDKSGNCILLSLNRNKTCCKVLKKREREKNEEIHTLQTHN